MTTFYADPPDLETVRRLYRALPPAAQYRAVAPNRFHSVIVYSTARTTFLATLSTVTDYEHVLCEYCELPAPTDDTHATTDNGHVCQDCYDDAYTYCDGCETATDANETTHGFCESCANEYLTTCERCGNCVHYEDTQMVEGSTWCDYCADNYSYWCEICDEAFADPDHANSHDCDCEPQHPTFSLNLAPPRLPLKNDTRIPVSLPSGTITEQGLSEIQMVVYTHVRPIRRETYDKQTGYSFNFQAVWDALTEVGDQWQTKRGNYPKRLSSAIYKATKIALPPQLLAKVGDIARTHSAGQDDLSIEITRDLNAPASHFAHSGSCWWGGYSESRCCLKSWAGFGIRSYESEQQPTSEPSGRAWAIPFDSEQNPTSNPEETVAYVIFNGYGNLGGYTPARILAQLTGMTYRKIEFAGDPMFVNAGGYLIFTEGDTNYQDTKAITLNRGIHDHA